MQSFTYDVFVSAPMTSIPPGLRSQTRLETARSVAALRAGTAGRVYYAGDAGTLPLPPAQSLNTDLDALAKSRCYVLVFPFAAVTSALAEAGFALGRGIPSLLLARHVDDLPWCLRESQRIVGHSIVLEVREYRFATDIPPLVNEFFRREGLT